MNGLCIAAVERDRTVMVQCEVDELRARYSALLAAQSKVTVRQVVLVTCHRVMVLVNGVKGFPVSLLVVVTVVLWSRVLRLIPLSMASREVWRFLHLTLMMLR